MEDTTDTTDAVLKIRSHPNGEFLGTMVNGQFILDKRSKVKLEQENIRRCKEQRVLRHADVLGEGLDSPNT